MKELLVLSLLLIMPARAHSQVLEFSSLKTRQIANLDRTKTVVIIPGGILEEHGPYLPAGSDAVFNDRLGHDLATFVSKRSGWSPLVFPSVPLGVGAANEMGGNTRFPVAARYCPLP